MVRLLFLLSHLWLLTFVGLVYGSIIILVHFISETLRLILLLKFLEYLILKLLFFQLLVEKISGSFLGTVDLVRVQRKWFDGTSFLFLTFLVSVHWIRPLRLTDWQARNVLIIRLLSLTAAFASMQVVFWAAYPIWLYFFKAIKRSLVILTWKRIVFWITIWTAVVYKFWRWS